MSGSFLNNKGAIVNAKVRKEVEELVKILGLDMQHKPSSEEFIREFEDKVDWEWISQYQKLSEEFIREFEDKVYWSWISEYQKLSEEFIREFKDEVDWYRVSVYQKLSKEFIREFKDEVDWECISRYQKLSEGFIREFKLNINHETSWLYKTEKQKLAYIRKRQLHKIYKLSKDKRHLYAYKSVRSDGNSVFNFQYNYQPGQEYESHCDCNTNDANSFGLSAWTKDKALDYYNKGKLMRVKIAIKDIGCFAQNNQKIRCHRLTVVEEVKI